MSDLTIIVPVYNEVTLLEEAVLTNLAALAELNLQGTVLIVNDGSQDGSGDLAETLADRYDNVRVIHHEANQGLGAGIRTGIREAQSEFIITSAVDSPLESATLAPFWANHSGADVIFGYRESKPGYSGVMMLNSRIYHLLLRTVAGIPFRDVNWHQMYRRSIFENFELQFNGIAMMAEVAIKAHHLGFTVKEVPCNMIERESGRGSASRFSVMVKTGLDLLNLLIRCIFRRFRPLGITKVPPASPPENSPR